MRPRIFLFGLAAVIILALVLLSLADSLLVDLLWFSTLGYRQVFIITLGAQVAIFATVWAVAFLAIWISGMIPARDLVNSSCCAFSQSRRVSKGLISCHLEIGAFGASISANSAHSFSSPVPKSL